MLAIDFSMLAGDLQSSLSTLETSVSTAVNQAPSIPILGAGLGSNPGLTQAIGGKATSLQSAFQAVASDVASHPGASDAVIMGFVQNELSSVGTGIVVTPNINADGTWRFQILLHQDLAGSSVHPQFNADLGSFFSLTSTGSLDLKVGMDYLLQFTFDPTTSAISLESTNLSTTNPSLPNASLALELSAAPSTGFSINGTLAGLLHLSATDDGTQFTGTYGVSIASASQVNVALTAMAHVGLHASLDFGTGDLPFNPKLTSDFHFDWSLTGAAITGGLNANTFGSMTNIGFDDVSIDAGSFFGTYVASLVKDIQQFTKPMQPIIDVINAPIPGLSDLGLNVSLRTLLGIDGSGYDDALDAITAIDNIDPSSLGGSGAIDLGSFTLNSDIRLNGPTINTSNVASNIMQQAQTDAGSSLNQVGGGGTSGFQFPILTDPLHTAFAMLTGQDATLFSFKMPSLTVPLSIEIPILAIPPFAGLFADVSVAFTFDLSVGYDTHGLREFVADTASGADAEKLTDDVLDGFYLDNSTNSDGHAATGFDITGGISLAAKAIVLKVSGGLFADVDLHLDPTLDDAQQHVRLGALADELGDGSDPFTASGSIFVAADLQIVIPAIFGDIVLADVQLAHITLVDFDSNDDSPQYTTNNTIFIDKDSDSENIDVKMEQEDPSSFNTSFSQFNVTGTVDPKAFVEAIVVSYPDHKVTYPVGYFQHINGNLVGEDLEVSTSDVLFTEFQPITNGTPDDGWTPIHYNLVATTPALDLFNDPEPETGNQTISVGNIVGDADGTPVNAVLIGGSGNDILEYQGQGKAVLIGGGGDDKLRAFNQQAQQVDEFGDDIDPNVFNVNTINFPMPDDTRQRILAHVVTPSGTPAHTSNVLAGAGANVFLGGGTWDNFFEGGSIATYVGGAGQNEFKIEAKLADPTAPVIPGSIIADPTADNTVIVDRTGLPASVVDNVTLRADNGNIHITGYLTDITISSTFTLAIDMDGGTLDIGDLSSLGPVHMVVNRGASASAPTKVLLDTPMTGLLDPLEITKHGPVDPEANPNLFSLDALQGPNADQPGASVEMIGFTASDSLDVTLHGGQVNVGDVDGSGMGLIKIDGSVRPANSTAVDDITVTTHPENVSAAPDPQGDTVVRLENSATPYDVEIDDHRAQDITTFVVPTQDKGNVATFDASQMKGTLHLDVGGATAKLLQVAPNLTVTVAGTDPTDQAEVTVGDGNLAHIESDVSLETVELTIDNSTSTAAPIFTMNAGSFTGWSIPGSSFEPSLNYSNLESTLTIAAGAGDRFQLDATPASITDMEVSDNTDILDSVYTANWSVPLTLDGSLSLFLGERLHTDNTVERVEHLTGVQTSFTLNRSGDPASDIVLDAALDAPGASYSLGGHSLDQTDMFVSNVAGGLDVEMNHLRPPADTLDQSGPADELRMDLTGATVNADLQFTPNNIITFDGSDRFAGNNPSAANTYNVTTEGIKTGIDMEPVGPNYTRTMIGNTLNVIGSMPQDALTINVLMDLTGAAYQTTLDGSELHGQLNVDAQDASEGALEHQLEAVLFPGPVPTTLGAAFSSDNILLKAARPDLNVNLKGTTNYDSIILFEPLEDYAPDNLFPAMNEFLDEARLAARNEAIAPTFFAGSGVINLKAFDYTFSAVASTVTIGDGTLAKIQGNVSVNDAAVTIDDHQGVDANIIQMTTTTVTGWATPSNSHPTLTVGTVYGAFTFHASTADRFNVTGTPNHWWEQNTATALQLLGGDGVFTSLIAVAADDTNFTTRTTSYDDTIFFHDDRNVIDNPGTGATSDIYITGKDMMPMSITGNFNLYAGRVLNPDGSVVEGTVDNIIKPTAPAGSPALASSITREQPIAFTYTGPGTDIAVWDASQDVLTQSFVQSVSGSDFYGVFASPANPGLGTLYYLDGDYAGESTRTNDGFGTLIGTEQGSVRGQLVYGANTELSFYAPQIPANALFEGAVFDNPVPTPVHYYSNPADPSNTQEQVGIFQTVGTVDVHGTAGVTSVLIQPPAGITAFTFVDEDSDERLLAGGENAVPYLSSEQYLSNSVLGDVYVTDAALDIEGDNSNTLAAPSVLANVVVTQTEVTGLAGGIIHISNLSNLAHEFNADFNPPVPENGGPTAGLDIDLPGYGTASVTVQDTPPGVITALDDVSDSTPGPNNTTVLATTGGLAFVGHYNGPTITFGNDGSLDSLRGNIYLTQGSSVDKVFDGHLDSPRTVTSAALPFGQTEVSGEYEEKISGLMPANIYLTTDIANLDIDGGAGDTFNISYAGTTSSAWRIFAGPQSTVNLILNPFTTPSPEIYGAQNVNVPFVGNTESGDPIKVFKSPTRPNDPINVSFDLSGATNQTTTANGLTLERLDSATGDLRANFFSAPWIEFPSDVTNLSIKSSTSSQISTITVNDTPAANTIIDPAHATLSVNATSGPLTILQGIVANPVTIGASNNMQSIAGAVTISANDSTRPTTAVRLSDSLDTVGRTAVFSNVGGVPQVAGLAPAPVIFSGTLATVTITGGTGANTLVGPDGANVWQLTGANAGTLNTMFAYSKFANLKGGSGTDDFFFTSTSSTVSGAVDAGAGFDTAHYSPGVLNGTETINLAAGIVPKISGSATNFEAVDVETHVALVPPLNQVSGKTHPITPLTVQVTGGGGTRTFSATGLPMGLSIDPQSGVISGTVAGTVADNTVFNSTVSVSDLTGTASASFTWKVASGLVLANPSSQIGKFFNNANLAIGFNNDFGTNVTFSAQNLPPGLSINPQTGVISGTFLPGTASPIVTPVTVTATDGVHSSQVNFTWTVSDSAGTLHADLAGADGGVISFVSSAGTQLKAAYFDPTSLNAPTDGYSLPFGGISLEVDGLHPGGSAEITITPPRGVNLDQLLDYSSGSWIHLLGQAGNVSAHVSGGNIVVDLVDGESGEFNPAFDGTISAYLVPLVQQLSATVGNVPTQMSPGQSVTLESDLAGVLAPSAVSTWQVTQNGNVLDTVTGSTFNFSPQQPGGYVVTLTAADAATGVTAIAEASIAVTPSLGSLNTGTPAGTPYLAGILEPNQNEGIDSITPVTLSNLAGSPTIIYFTAFDQDAGNEVVWQYDGSRISPVMIEGTSQQLSGFMTTVAVDGRWAAMVDTNDGDIWAVTPDGARLIVSSANGLSFPQNAVAVGDTLYFSARDDVSQNQLRSVRLDGTGNPVITQVTNLFDETNNNFAAASELTPFAGGLAFVDEVGPYEDGVEPSQEVFLLTGGSTPVVKQISIDAPQGFPSISSLAVIDGPAGTSKLIFTRSGNGSPASLYSFDSSDVNDANPTATEIDIASPDQQVELGDLTAVGSQVYFTTNANESSTRQIWVSDGTAAGTQQLDTDALPDAQRPSSFVNAGGQLNFLSSNDDGDVSLWTIDSASGQPVEVSDLGSFAQLFAVGGRLYADLYDQTSGTDQLWSSAGGASQLTLVPSNPNNPYFNPGVIAADDQGVVYFSASSAAVQDGFGQPTNQLWVLGPAFTSTAGGAATALSLSSPTDAFAGSAPTVTISATTALGDPASSFAGPVSVQLDDGDGNTVFSTSGNFSGGVYSIQLPALTTAGAVDATYTLKVTSNDLTAQSAITVHPIVHFGPTSSTVVVAGAGQAFSLSMQADNDRQFFASNYTGQVTLSYTDTGGTHQLGPVTAVQGIVTFTGLVLPSPGAYTFTATSADGLATGSFVVTVPKAIQFTTTSSDPTQVADTDVFDFDIVAADVAGNPAAGYTGLILVTLTDPNGVSTSTSYYVAPDQQSHLVLKGLTLPVDGQYHLRLSDGIVASTLTINSSVKQVLPGDFNDDGKVDATDIDTLFGLIKTGDARGDLNDDGSVNQQDLDFLIHNILHTEFGDANLDGFVDTSDLAVVRKAMGSSLSGPDWAHGDFNGDGVVDVADLAIVRGNTGFATASQQSQQGTGTAEIVDPTAPLAAVATPAPAASLPISAPATSDVTPASTTASVAPSAPAADSAAPATITFSLSPEVLSRIVAVSPRDVPRATASVIDLLASQPSRFAEPATAITSTGLLASAVATQPSTVLQAATANEVTGYLMSGDTLADEFEEVIDLLANLRGKGPR